MSSVVEGNGGMNNIRKQTFTIEVCTKKVDGCGNEVKSLTPSDIRKALMRGLPYFDAVSVQETTVEEPRTKE